MMERVTLGRYVPGASPVHRLDPRTKIVAVAAGMAGLMLARHLELLLGAIGLTLALSRLARLPVRLLFGNFGPLIPICALTLAFNAFGTSGDTVFVLPGVGWAATAEGVSRGLFLSLRLIALVLGVALLTLTTSPLELADGIESLLGPLRRVRVPVHELAMTATIALRFVPMLADEALRVRNAQLSRGADFGGGPIRRARAALPLVLPLFVSAFGRADRLAVAMESRAYQGSAGRTRYRRLRLRPVDWLVMLAVPASVVAVVTVAA